MKKRAKRLTLHRETLRRLDGTTLHRVRGGQTNIATDCEGCAPTCDPANCPHTEFCGGETFFCCTETGSCPTAGC